MKDMNIKIPDDSTELVTVFIEKIGGIIETKEKRKATKKNKLKKNKAVVEHDFLFGKWKDFDIDARKIREELWRRP